MPRLHHRIKRQLHNAFIPHEGNDYRPHALRQPWLHVTAVTAIMVKVVVIAAVSFYASAGRVSDITPTTIVALTNQARQARKVAPVKLNPLLTKAAEKKAADMAQKQYFAHISPTGVSPWTWFKQAGYSYTYAGENLALDFVSGEDVIDAWLKSPTHRSNLLGTKYKDIGVAVVSGKIGGVTSLIVVQMFGAPTPVAATKKVTVPTQTPLPKVAKETLEKTTPAVTPPVIPPTQVLGEVAPAVAPGIPTMTTPEANSLVRTSLPEVVGRAEPSSIVTLYVNGARVATSTADANTGIFSVIPTAPLAEGLATVQVSASARGLTGGMSEARAVNVDTQAPTIEVQRSTILPSYLATRGYDLAVVVSGDPKTVVIQAGDQTVPLVAAGDIYRGSVQLSDRSVTGAISVQATDSAGNNTENTLAATDFLTTGVVASTSGPFTTSLRLVFFSRAFLFVLLLLVFMAAMINVLVEWRHQHHPTIIHSLLVVFLVGTLLVM